MSLDNNGRQDGNQETGTAATTATGSVQNNGNGVGNNPLGHLNDSVNSLDPLNAMEKSLNDQMPHTPNTPHTPGNGGSASHPMTPIGGPPSVNNGPGGNHSPQQQQQHQHPQQQHQLQHSMNSGAEGCGQNGNGNNSASTGVAGNLNMYEPDLSTELGFINGNAEADLNVRTNGFDLFKGG